MNYPSGLIAFTESKGLLHSLKSEHGSHLIAWYRTDSIRQKEEVPSLPRIYLPLRETCGNPGGFARGCFLRSGYEDPTTLTS
jgi:hypothetical protein